LSFVAPPVDGISKIHDRMGKKTGLDDRESREKSNIIQVSISYPNQVQNEAQASTQSLDTRTGSSKILHAVCILHLINRKDKTNARSSENSAQRWEDENPENSRRKIVEVAQVRHAYVALIFSFSNRNAGRQTRSLALQISFLGSTGSMLR
jgi:hypothetical protein